MIAIRPTLTCLLLVTGSLLAAEPSAVAPLMKLLSSGRLPPERIPAVVEMICNRGNDQDLRVVFDRAVSGKDFSSELRIQALTWLGDAASTRKIQPAGDLTSLSALVVNKDSEIEPALRQKAIRLASICRVASVAPALQELALDAKTPAPLKKAAIEGLVVIGDPGSLKSLVKLAQPGQPAAIRVQAVAGLVGLDLPVAAEAAARVLAELKSGDDPAPMLNAFFEQKGGAEALAEALQKSAPPADAAKLALRYMYSVGRSDGALSTVLGNAAGVAADPPPPTPEEVAKLVADVEARGNPQRGEAVFRRADLSCLKCHAVSRAGGQIGPDLSAVGGSSPTDYIVNSILNPNLAVKEQYVTKVFELDSGKVLTGVVIDRDDVRVNLRDASGQVIVVPTADIEDEIEGRSLMPQGLTKFLTRDELIDLACFVSQLGKQGPYQINREPTIQRWRILREAPEELTASVPHLEHVRQFILGSEPSAWTPVYARVAGDLPLADLRSATAPAVVIVQGDVDVRTAGTLRLAIDSTENVQGWFDAEPLDARSSPVVTVAPGRHTLTLRVEISDRADPTLRVRVVAPDDSSAKFEIVGGT